MAHIYAGILGPLGFLITLARGLMHGGGTDSVLLSAWLTLLAFSVVGYVAGWIAERVVAESVRGTIAAGLAGEPWRAGADEQATEAFAPAVSDLGGT